jgi:hypothetical protein
VRPGRCFATVRTRALERGEAEALLARIMEAELRQDHKKAANPSLPADTRAITLAALYRLVGAPRAFDC